MTEKAASIPAILILAMTIFALTVTVCICYSPVFVTVKDKLSKSIKRIRHKVFILNLRIDCKLNERLCTYYIRSEYGILFKANRALYHLMCNHQTRNLKGVEWK